ncbi:hypothetical protein [Altererythrobacter sp. TH136]|uniref:hypothetical protein n=1 Tax=Altererythrobacter sp. TH136 TaxID=2067415 RepID=UPI001164B341|nr:hypothetical protein [Altererythrobacter sp. TH136]QDM41448.1 hypothetical protein C0V74_10650 [Altererythrobacter sp. TH136]
MAADPTYNLTALADRLGVEGRLPALAGKIRRARELHSLHTDLVMALESVAALDNLLLAPTDLSDHGKMITESALLNNAILLYARATKTASDERKGFDPRPRFDERQKAIHRELCDLRDAAIAHFGSGGVYSGEWQAELSILQFRGEDAKVAVVTRRQTVDKGLVKRVRAQIEAALPHFRDAYLGSLDELTDALQLEADTNADFSDEIGQHPLNLALFMKSEQAADEARRSFDSEHARGAVAHS